MSDAHPDGNRYYSNIIIHVDTFLIILNNPDAYMPQLENEYYVKKDSTETLDIYLGAQLKYTQDHSRKLYVSLVGTII